MFDVLQGYRIKITSPIGQMVDAIENIGLANPVFPDKTADFSIEIEANGREILIIEKV